MKLLQTTLLVMLVVTCSYSLPAQSESNTTYTVSGDSILIETIIITKNWITWNRIIKNELLFQEGDKVSIGKIDTSINKVWNISIDWGILTGQRYTEAVEKRCNALTTDFVNEKGEVIGVSM